MVTGQSLRFALQADGSSLATGMYDYTLTVAKTIGGVTTNQARWRPPPSTSLRPCARSGYATVEARLFHLVKNYEPVV